MVESSSVQPGDDAWTVDRLGDLSGRTVFITGANRGLGLEAAKYLRAANADVIVGARSVDSGTAAVESLRQISGAGSVKLVRIDLADTASIRVADKALREVTGGLDAVVNNAGVMQTPQLETADGFELQFGTNHLGHFLLNALVFDLVKARGGRIVPVSSVAHLRARPIDFNDVMFTKKYSPTFAYGQSKLANITYGLELARRLEQAGSTVSSVICHPGYAATNLQISGPTGFFKALYRITNPLFAQSAAAGAVPLVMAAASDGVRNGGYYGPTGMGGIRGRVGESRVAGKARKTDEAEKLWKLSEDLLNITFQVS